MKKLRPNSYAGARKAACMVSAAALMLGISHAATVGINFPNDYCGSTLGYVNYVNVAAFGIPQSGWESLSPTGTGYSACSGPLYYYGQNVIDTTSHAPVNGITTNAVVVDSFPNQFLNPLPNGSLTVFWGCPTANWSGFAGYNSGHANQPKPSSGPPRGEAEVYAGFLRDGINFGPPGGNDNNQPGWFVDITGLKSLFTNSPFVIELVASSDSMYHLTNSFIIDATLNVTQSVTYPNTQAYGPSGDAPWYRATGGGLSTVTPLPLVSDHVQIIPNRPQHSATNGQPRATTTNNAATLSGIIITDQPVVTMSPQPVLAAAHDNVTLHTIAIGVPPLFYQWRNGGAPISGATNADYLINDITSGGNFDLVVTNLYGSATSKVSVVTVDRISVAAGPSFFLDTKPSGTAHDASDFGTTWLASSTDAASVTRNGVAQFASGDPDQITIAGSTDFDSTNGTVMFWVRSAGTNTSIGNEGATLFDRRNGDSSGIALVQQDDGRLLVTPHDADAFVSTKTISDNKWHHVAVTYDQAGQTVIYIDGAFDNNNSAVWQWPVGQQIELGKSHDVHWRAYNGLMDDVRFYNRILTAPEIASVSSGDALVDTSALKVRLNFDSAPLPGITMTWKIADAVLQSATAVTGPYTDVSSPGPTSPSSVSATSTAKFYRYRHTATSINSNPFDM